MDASSRCKTKNVYFKSSNRALFFFLPILFLALSAFKNSAKAPGMGDELRAIQQIRENIIDYGRNYLGLKYRYAGVSPLTGFDCSGFTSYLLKSFDVKVSAGSAMQATQGDKIPLDAVQTGDLVFFGRKGRITHVAMVVERTAEGIFCIHSTCSRGVVIENITTSKYWSPKIMFARDVISGQFVF